MTNIVVNPLVLFWKHNNEPGITCKGPSGYVELTEWPESLGEYPTQDSYDIWESEYTAMMSAKSYIPARRADYITKLLSAKGYKNGDEIDCIGFVSDALINEIRSISQAIQGYTSTTEFTELCAIIDAVKTSNPKP